MEIYLVGGAVRDALLGLEVKDRDWVVVGATPQQMQQKGYRQVGADFPVFLHPVTGEEYALARTERKAGQGYHGFTVYSAPDVTLEDDLLRRDLTINAMAQSTDGTIVDPFNGRADLDRRILRHVSDAFAEDPLRILRTARFAARFGNLGFRVADETMALMTRMVEADEVEHLVPERVWQEIQRALGEPAPEVFFQVLDQCGALARLIPELATGQALATALEALACICDQKTATEPRYAALMSPVDPELVRQRSAALKCPNAHRELATLVAARKQDLLHASTPEAQLDVLEQCDAWRRPERFEELLVVCQCLNPPLPSGAADRLRQAEAAARAVDPTELLAQGFSGKAMGEAIRNRRLEHIRALNSHSNDGPEGRG